MPACISAMKKFRASSGRTAFAVSAGADCCHVMLDAPGIRVSQAVNPSSRGVDFRCPFGIIVFNRSRFAQRTVQLYVQLDGVARGIAAKNLEVLGLPARLAEGGKSIGFHRFESGAWVGVVVVMRMRLLWVVEHDGRLSVPGDAVNLQFRGLQFS